jgi:small-conductance mechanosensitive channel
MPILAKRDPIPEEDRDEEAQQAPVNEHTRLLPNRVDSSRPMLRPDDPAVSPYNLWTVRVLRYLTVLFALLTFIWWVLLAVSAFATPPGFHTRGSGFYAFGYASLTLANVLFALVFFGVPAKSVRILAVVLSVRIPPCYNVPLGLRGRFY